MGKAWLVLLVILVVGGGYYFLKYSGGAPYTSMPQDASIQKETMQIASSSAQMMESQIQIEEQNKSGEYGTATLVEKDGKVTVTLNMTGGKAGVEQPAHIHTGMCPDIKSVVYPLENVVDGKSVTVLDATLVEIAAQQPLGINVHKSEKEAKNYVSCGDLNLPGGSPSSASSSGKMMGY